MDNKKTIFGDEDMVDILQDDSQEVIDESIEFPSTINEIDVNPWALSKKLLILFGPRGVGKTVALIRLAMYLEEQGFTVTPNYSFYENYSKYYEKIVIPKFELARKMMANGKAPDRTMDFLLLDVKWKGKDYAKIIDGPGENYFNPNTTINDYRYLTNIYSNSNIRRITAFFFEPKMKSQLGKLPDGNKAYTKYINEIGHILGNKVGRKDRVLFIYNKTNELFNVDGKFKYSDKEFLNLLRAEFNENGTNIIDAFIARKKAAFIPYFSGSFIKVDNEKRIDFPRNNILQYKLWTQIKRKFKGR